MGGVAAYRVVVFPPGEGESIVHPVVLSAAGIVVGGTLAGVTLIGVIQSQTDAPGQSPANVSQPFIDYGTAP